MRSDAEKLLERMPPGWKSLKFPEYVTYVRGQFCRPTWTLDDLAILCRHYRCPIDDLATKVAKDKFGKG